MSKENDLGTRDNFKLFCFNVLVALGPTVTTKTNMLFISLSFSLH